MEDKNKKNESDIIVEAESIIDRHVRAKEQELLDKATISAAILCSAIAVFLSYHSGFSGLGSY